MKNLAELAKKNREQQKKETRLKASMIVIMAVLIVAVIAGIIAVSVITAKHEPEPAPSYEPSAQTTSEPTVPVEGETLTLYLQSGYYTAGVDIPSGTYDLEVICGNGYVTSDNYEFGRISESMGTYDNSYSSAFRGMILNDGNTLKIDGVTLKLTSTDASTAPLAGREAWAEEGYTLVSGNHKAGRDFPAGVYDIFYSSGNGYVDLTNEDESIYDYYMIGTDPEWDTQVFYHCNLPEGTEIAIGNVQIDIYPSGLIQPDYYTPIEAPAETPAE